MSATERTPSKSKQDQQTPNTRAPSWQSVFDSFIAQGGGWSRKPHQSRETAEFYRSNALKWAQWMDGSTEYVPMAPSGAVDGRVPTDALRPMHVTEFMKQVAGRPGLKGGRVADTTLGNYSRGITTMLRFALFDNALCATVPGVMMTERVLSHLRVHSDMPDLPPLITDAQRDIIIANAGTLRNQAIIATALGAGLRRKELAGMRWGDICDR